MILDYVHYDMTNSVVEATILPDGNWTIRFKCPHADDDLRIFLDGGTIARLQKQLAQPVVVREA